MNSIITVHATKMGFVSIIEAVILQFESTLVTATNEEERNNWIEFIKGLKEVRAGIIASIYPEDDPNIQFEFQIELVALEKYQDKAKLN